MANENEQFYEVLKELQRDMLNPELVQDNKLHFRVEENIYRVRMPSQKEISQANDFRNRKYMELLQKKNEDGTYSCLLEKNLIKLLKDSQNIDIEAFDIEIKNLEKCLIDKYLSLAQLKDTDKTSIDNIKKEIEEIKNNRLTIILERAGYLAVSIQNQAQEQYVKYLTAVCTEKYTETDNTGSWLKVWKSLEDYNNDDTNLSYIALGRLTELTLNV